MDNIEESDFQEWKEFTPKCRSFIFGTDPEVIHIIKSGFDNEYFVIEDIGYRPKEHGECNIMSREKIFEKFKLKID